MQLAEKAQAIEPGVHTSPWPDHELLRGYAVMVLPFSTGDLLGLRVWLQNDFAPYASVWHRTADGAWRMYNDGPAIEATCPRYWGAAIEHAELTDIELFWTGPNELRVEMDDPPLTWTMEMTAPAWLRAMNAVSTALPL